MQPHFGQHRGQSSRRTGGVRVFVEFVSNVDQRERASELAGEQVCVCVCVRESV